MAVQAFGRINDTAWSIKDEIVGTKKDQNDDGYEGKRTRTVVFDAIKHTLNLKRQLH